jgi:predicted DNA-binding WGR domain protein
MPRYEHRDGTSGKFWEIELSGNEFTVRYGAIGAKGREQIKSFATPELARREHDKLVAEKLRKGYAAVGGAADPAAALRRDFYVYNEATGMLVTSARLGGKGWDNGGKAWEKGVRNGDLIPVELVQDGPFVIRVVVGGGLEPQEAEEWVGRLDWKLRVPDGDLVVCGGPEYVLEDFDDEDDSPVAEFVRRMDIPRGEYRATLYTYLGGAALSERLGSLPDGSVVELDAAFIDEVEHGVERPAGLHRHRGTVRGGRLAVEEAFPTADVGRLNAALALSEGTPWTWATRDSATSSWRPCGRTSSSRTTPPSPRAAHPSPCPSRNPSCSTSSRPKRSSGSSATTGRSPKTTTSNAPFAPRIAVRRAGRPLRGDAW